MLVKNIFNIVNLLIFVLSANIYAADAYVFQSVITEENATQASPQVQLNVNGGSITYDVVYNSSCQGTYQMDWTFSKSIQKLYDGDQFSITIQCVVCQDICGFRWGEAWGNVSDAGNITSIPGVENYVYNGNIDYTASTGTVKAYDTSTFTQQTDLKATFLKSADDTAFKLNLGRHGLYYHYKFVASAPTADPVPTAIQKMYVAYYGRPGDPAGESYWNGILDGGDLSSIISAFGDSDEYRAGLGAGDTTSQVTSLYQQMFGRDPESDGLDYWVGQISAGTYTLAQVALAVAGGAQGTDVTTLSNKVLAAQYYTDQITATGASYGSSNIASAKAIIFAVTSDTTTLTSAYENINNSLTK